MPRPVIRGGNGRRHEVDEDAEIRIEVWSGDETVEIVVEAVNDLAPSDRRQVSFIDMATAFASSGMKAVDQP